MKLADLLIFAACAYLAVVLIRMGEGTLVLIPVTIVAVFFTALCRANRGH